MLTNPVDLLRDLVAIPSVSQHENEVIDFLVTLLRRVEIPFEIIHGNLVVSFGRGERQLLLASHLDTVPGSPSMFQSTNETDFVVGRGSVDAKGCAVSMLAAGLQMKRDFDNPGSGRLVIALTICEEIEAKFNGMRRLRSTFQLPNAGVIGEPTSLRICVAQKGLLGCMCHTTGEASHAARPPRRRAIDLASEDISNLSRLPLSDGVDDWLGLPTVTVTHIHGTASAFNVIPERCEYFLDARTTPFFNNDRMLSLLRSTLKSEVRVCSDMRATRTPDNSELLSAAKVVLGGDDLFGSPTASDWAYLDDLDCIKLGPGDSRLSHTNAERLQIEEFNRAILVYRNIARQYLFQ